MKIVVCVRRLASGELNPFDACCYEAALRLNPDEIILLSMGPMPVKEFLLNLTRLGAKKAILLSDTAFAGADTLATSYALSLAIKKISPDLILCGRQTVDGDTGQVGPELATMLNIDLITNVMRFEKIDGKLFAETRDGFNGEVKTPSLLTVERINNLRLPSIRSKIGEIDVWTADDIGADKSLCGLSGSPTRVITTFKNEQDRRSCKFIPKEKLNEIIEAALTKEKFELPKSNDGKKLSNVWIMGNAPREMAETVSDDITLIPLDTAENLAKIITERKPDVILWGSDLLSKKIAPQVAALLQTGLCADCTLLETDGNELYMYRPAFSGDIIAKIKCLTRPQMATVRTLSESNGRVAVGLGFGVKDCLNKAKAFATKFNAELVASRKLVDNDFMPYDKQVGLTGKSINPDVYIAIGISGAVHHIAGIKQSGTIIAINPDKNAEIFKYADYGILCSIDDINF